MFARLYYSTALALLPSAEAVVKGIEKVVAKLDTITVHIEGQLEEHAVLLAKHAQGRRIAIDSIYNAYGTVATAVANVTHRLVDAVEAAFARRERAVLTEIGTLRSKLDKASAARDAVANILGL